MSKQVAVISYNAGNTLSVVAALSRLGVSSIISDDRKELERASHIIFPGVGHAAPAASYLADRGLDQVIKKAQQPVLGICLGMQLMCEFSEEGETTGLGLLPASCRLFRSKIKVPHMGWNSLSDLGGSLFKGVSPDCYVYFVHSFRVDCDEFTSAKCVYGETFSAAFEKDNFFGVQFHPEKSSENGQQILENFLRL